MHTFSIPVLTMYKIEGGQVHPPHQYFNQNPMIDPRTPDTPVPPGVHTLAITPPKCIGGGGVYKQVGTGDQYIVYITWKDTSVILCHFVDRFIFDALLSRSEEELVTCMPQIYPIRRMRRRRTACIRHIHTCTYVIHHGTEQCVTHWCFSTWFEDSVHVDQQKVPLLEEEREVSFNVGTQAGPCLSLAVEQSFFACCCRLWAVENPRGRRQLPLVVWMVLWRLGFLSFFKWTCFLKGT